MTFEQIRLFKDIAQTRSVSKAASLSSISQSAASQSLQEIERLLQSELVDRSRRPLELTAAGKIFQDFCRDVLRRRETFDVALGQMRDETEGTVRVASIYSVGLSEMVELERKFAQRIPSARLDVEYLRPEKVYSAVEADEADLGLVSYAEPTREITVIPWREEEMVVAVSPYHPLAGNSTVEPADLQSLDFIGFDDELPIQRDIERYLRERDVQVNAAFHFDNLQMIKEAVAHQVGVSILPMRIMLEEIGQGRLVAIPFATPDLFRPLGIIHRKRKRFHKVAQAFLDLLMETPAA
ncbi:MAG: LysR family transcriptional regulator [Bryobacteraceae bacterium]